MDQPHTFQVGSIAQLEKCRSIKFIVKGERFDRDGFVILDGAVPKAYYNECPHLGITLDFDDNEFFSPDGNQLVCKNHGALFNVNDGECTAGPCQASHLKSIETKVENGDIWVTITQRF